MSAENVETEKEEKQEFIQAMTAKEIKKLARPEFAANPDKFYPTKTLAKLGYKRAQCVKCKNNFWRIDEARTTCGDSQCEGKYSFIGRGTGIGRKGKKITYSQAWEGFSKSLSSARVPCTPIARYPVVARWRADVDFVAAGIFCFQPYCVTGELEPPANPLICPQFCLRFNDLDNIGLTGRHYSGFVMLGIQVFNKPGKRKFWMDECVEFNYRWLTEELGIDPKEITFIEDVWAGGGNLGPSIEYFVNGLELGNMVFMQFKTFPDGHREELDVQVIDVGIGLERVPWLINGTATSYVDVFRNALEFLLSKVNVNIEASIWEKYGPLSCLLNVDEVDDIDKTWEWIAGQIGEDVKKVKQAIEPIREAYVVLDHTRSVLMAIQDGSLPSNVGGASNIRNILRRVFAILHRNKWWDLLGMDGFLELFERHRVDLAALYGPFSQYKSFRPIIELEFQRWKNTDEVQKAKLQKLLSKKKGQKLTMDDWILCVTSWGLPADSVAKETGEEVPGNLWYEIADRQERTVKALPTVLYNTNSMPPTDSIYYAHHKLYEFTGKIVALPPNVEDKNSQTIVVLDKSAFYPTSGGQEHDTGSLVINGATYEVKDVLKVGACVFHVITPALPGNAEKLIGTTVTGKINEERRNQLRNNHTATHIVYASSRKVLGPHVWQNGAKKTVESAHLDITHYDSLSHEEVTLIENEANRIVNRCRDIRKGFMAKDEAEKKFGFNLYQGGVVPGNELRVVDIDGTDTEACCGTHADNTAEVGSIKILKTARISDGIVRLYFVAGENALVHRNKESDILHELIASWGISQKEILPTATRFFDGYKKYGALVEKQAVQILDLTIKVLLADPATKLTVIRSESDNPTIYIGQMPNFAVQLKESKKGVLFLGDNFLYGLLGDAALFDVKKIEAALTSIAAASEEKQPAGAAADKKKKPALIVKNQVQAKSGAGKKADKVKVDGVAELTAFSLPKGADRELASMLIKAGFASQGYDDIEKQLEEAKSSKK